MKCFSWLVSGDDLPNGLQSMRSACAETGWTVAEVASKTAIMVEIMVNLVIVPVAQPPLGSNHFERRDIGDRALKKSLAI